MRRRAGSGAGDDDPNATHNKRHGRTAASHIPEGWRRVLAMVIVVRMRPQLWACVHYA
jgi:hypothetical protein